MADRAGEVMSAMREDVDTQKASEREMPALLDGAAGEGGEQMNVCRETEDDRPDEVVIALPPFCLECRRSLAQHSAGECSRDVWRYETRERDHGRTR